MNHQKRFLSCCATLIWLSAVIVSACGPKTGSGEDECPFDECIVCENQEDCPANMHCPVDGGYCTPNICTPGESFCENGSVISCNDIGSGYLEPRECETGVCVDGNCGCSDEDDCLPGEECINDFCVCVSGVTCGNHCCAEGETCREVEICEGDECRLFQLCRPVCEGEVCGEAGELCCKGDTPACGPLGECVESCEGLGELCGENFDTCCPAGDVCVFGECRTPGEPCWDFSDCDFGYYCDPGVGRCMPDDFPEDIVCEMDYDFADFEPELLWHWQGVEYDGRLHVNVAMTPVVADMTGNGIPDVVVNAYPTGSSSRHMPVVISGETGETIYFNPTRWARTWSQIALVDITGDGLPEFVMQTTTGVGVIKNLQECPAVTPSEDCFLWFNSSLGTISAESQIVADITADGNVEIFVNNRILNGATGDLITSLPGGMGYDYTVVADITGDGKMELLGTRCLYALDVNNEPQEIWCNSDLPGAGMRFVAMGDVVSAGGRAGLPEFVISGTGANTTEWPNTQIYFVAAETGEILHQLPLPGGGRGGPPVIADFDGDGRAEVGIAGKGCYTVFDMDCLGPVDEDLPGCIRPVIPPCTQGVDCFEVEACPDLADTFGTGNGMLWSVFIQDKSSSRTGSSVFDFQGDGRNEVVYNDECQLMVFDGQTGIPQFLVANTSRTASEYPIVVDVNGDNRTNIVVAANNDQFTRDCREPMETRPDRYPECHGDEPIPDWCTQGTTGVFAYQDPEDRWVRTRKIWNQFAYHIENVTDDARAPTSPPMPWETHNTFRANRQGEVPLNAADPAVTKVQANTTNCPPTLVLRVTIRNNGVASIPPWMPVTLYDAVSGEVLKTIYLSEPISPGGIKVVEIEYDLSLDQIDQELTFVVVANDDGTGDSHIFDCDPDSASYVFGPILCSSVTVL